MLLGALLVEANRSVVVDRLVTCLWGDRPPRTARNSMQNYVLRLRRALTSIAGECPLASVAGGYRLDVADDEVDLRRFETLTQHARSDMTAGELVRASTTLRSALELWRGRPLADVPSEVLQREVVPALAEQRLAALALRIDVDLRLGRQRDLVTELTSLAVRFPLREQFWAQLMLALYRCGRAAEALEAYHKVRTLLAEDLGVDPGPELRELYQRVLAGDPGLTVAETPPSRVEVHRPVVVPRQLPPAPRYFTERTAALAALTKATDEAGGSDGTTVITAVRGTGGIGKTSLAVYWAHQQRDRWPDGQLFVDLRGFSPAGRPMAPATAVRGFLEALGVAPTAIPVELDAQVGLYRSLVADRRMLIVLDNARDTAQVAPLLPGSPACTVVVTSRDRLDGLVTSYGARSLPLDTLSPNEARALLAARLGADRLAAEPDAVAELLACCVGFPLALSIVASRAEIHPDFPLATFAEKLRDAATRLGTLDDDDPMSSLPAVLSWSYRSLTAEQAGVFRLIGAAPGPDISAPAAVALTGMLGVETVLRGLERASLVQQHVPGRYRMHDLVRLYAADQTRTDPDTGAAVGRLLDFYLHTAFAADRLKYSRRPLIDIGPPPPDCRLLPLRSAEEALAWFDREHACLLAAQQKAAESGRHDTVWQLAWVLNFFHRRRGHRHDRRGAWRAALAAADHLDDPRTRALAHRQLGDTFAELGDRTAGLAHLEQALALARHAGDARDQGMAHQALAVAWEQFGDDRRALRHATEALRIYRALDVPMWVADMLNAVGWLSARLGRYAEGRAACEAALALHARHHDRDGDAATLDSLGYIAHHTGQYDEAVSHYRQALALRRDQGSLVHEANTLDRLGDTYAAIGQCQQARESWLQALELYRTQQRTADADRVRERLATLATARSSSRD